MDKLEEIRSKSEELATLKLQIQTTESGLTTLKKAAALIEENHLPALMDEIGLTAYTLTDGAVIECKDFVSAKIKDEATAFTWLRETNNDGIIKNSIAVFLDKGDDARAQLAVSALNELDIPAEHKQAVHHTTLKSFVTEALTNPDLQGTIPKEAFGVNEFRKVVFKSAK